MGNDKTSWDHIPTLEGLEIDWGYEPENPLGKRAYARITAKELKYLLSEEKEEIPLKFVTERSQHVGYLINLSQGGIRLQTKKYEFIKQGQLIKIGLDLGRRKLITKGRIKSLDFKKDMLEIGVEFVGLQGEDDKYIASLYSSVKL